MTMTDPIADMLTRLRNANSAYHDTVTMPYSKLKSHIAEILKAEGYVASWKVEDAPVGKYLTIELKFGPYRERSLAGIRRISKPGLRESAENPGQVGGLGIHTQTWLRDAAYPRERALSVRAELQLDGEVLANRGVLHLPAGHVTFSLQDLRNVRLQLRVRHGYRVVVSRVRIAQTCQHVCNRIGHCHRASALPHRGFPLRPLARRRRRPAA